MDRLFRERKLRELMLMYKQKAAYNSDMASRYQSAQTRLRRFEVNLLVSHASDETGPESLFSLRSKSKTSWPILQPFGTRTT